MSIRRYLTVLAVIPMIVAGAARAAEGDLIHATIGDDGLHKQDWFAFSFMNLPEDLAEARAEGKHLVIMWEQKGCPYCKDLHEKVLSQPDINAYMADNFYVVQMNLWGDKPVTNFDGTETTEKEIARTFNVQFTPTIQFFPPSKDDMKGYSGMDAELFRLPGFFRPFHFKAALEYVHEGIYKDQPNFQRYILEKANANNGVE